MSCCSGNEDDKKKVRQSLFTHLTMKPNNIDHTTNKQIIKLKKIYIHVLYYGVFPCLSYRR